MAWEGYINGTTGKKQGKYPGTSPRNAHKDKIPLLRVDYEILAPRDVSTGQAKGKRVHKPIKLLMEVDKATPYWLNSLTQNELLTVTNLEFWDKDDQGVDRHLFNIKLSDVHVVSARLFTGDEGAASSGATAKNPGEYDTRELFEVALSFRRIDFEHKVGGTVHADDWLTETNV